MAAARVVIVEDNPLTRKLLRVTLETDGYAVLEAADGGSALAAIESTPTDLLDPPDPVPAARLVLFGTLCPGQDDDV